MKVKAYVNGVECTIYHYTKSVNDNGEPMEYCACKFKAFPWTVPVLNSLVEVRCEND